MKELLQGRRLGFSLRASAASVATGLALGVTVLDLMSWFAWGTPVTNPLVVGAYWLTIVTAIVLALGALMAFAERRDVLDEERSVARVDLIAAVAAALLAIGSAVVRAGAQGAAGAPALAFLASIALLVLLVADGAVAANLYAAREWEIIEPEEPRDHRRRRAG